VGISSNDMATATRDVAVPTGESVAQQHPEARWLEERKEEVAPDSARSLSSAASSAASSPELLAASAAAVAANTVSLPVASLAGSKPGQGAPPVRAAIKVLPDSFDVHECFYPRAVNSNLHPLVASFLSLGNERIIQRYCHLNPAVSPATLRKLLSTPPRYFRWSGADLFHVTNRRGRRQMIVVETNSCPSGQKSMPMASGSNEDNDDGYHVLMRGAFKAVLDEREAAASAGQAAALPAGGLAVVFDKNPMEARGYATAMADVFREPVHLVELYTREKDSDPPVEWREDIMHVRDEEGIWHPIRAAFRYVTQRPWDRIPLSSRTLVLNSIISCLAGGRNKMAADKAYELLNDELCDSGLEIRTPLTIRDVRKAEVPQLLHSMGGRGVVKVPYSNAGQGVYTITSPAELAAFMGASSSRYDKYIVQALVGGPTWGGEQQGAAAVLHRGGSKHAGDASSPSGEGEGARGAAHHPNGMEWKHVGTVPNKKLQTFVSDLRCMVSATKDGFQPLALYARRALLPLVSHLSDSCPDSWAMLGTNLSVLNRSTGEWSTDTSRLLLMDMKDFNKLGLGLDELIDAYIQTCLATLAIDQMACRLTDEQGRFDQQYYAELNKDQGLLREIMHTSASPNAAASASGSASGAAQAATPAAQRQ